MCVASFRSMTIALKAKKTIEKNGIYANIIKLEPYMTKKGCSYGLSFECVFLDLIKTTLEKQRIKYSEIFTL